MYNDVQLPEDQAWAAMTADLKKCKNTRNALSKDNSHLKRKLQVVEQQNEEYVSCFLARHQLMWISA